ncbi:MAG: type II secretion system protein GspK, partial [Pirellulaceae bacterium]
TVSPTASTSISGGATGATDSTTFFRGWASYLTLYSAEGNVRPDGTARIFLNNTDLNALSEELLAVFDESYTNFILAYRLYGSANSQATGSQSGQGGAAPGSNQATGRTQVVEAEDLDLDLSQQPQGTFAQVLDLIGKQVQVPGANGVTQIVNSPFLDDPAEMADYLPLLMENCSVSEAPMVPGRININEAAPELLYGIPGISEELAAEIVVRRSELGVAYEPAYRHETWLLTEGLVTVDEMRALLPFVTARGSVFRAQIVGYYQGGGPSSRAEAVFDATETTPRLLFWRDLSHLGRGYPLDILGVDMVGTP